MSTTFIQRPSGLYVPKGATQKRKRPTAFSFFAGCGGMDLGFLQAGLEIVGANEYDEAASLTYLANLGSYPVNIHYVDGEVDKERLNKACERYIFGKRKKKDELRYGKKPLGNGNVYRSNLSGSGWIRNNPDVPPVRNFWFGDVRMLKGRDILETLGMQEGEIDVVIGGPPCQGFSQAGKQNIADPRNNLVYEYARMIVELQPKTFVMEEVPAILNFFDPDGMLVLDKFAMIISEGGYGTADNIRKAMMMQSGCIVPKSMVRGNERVKSTKSKPPKSKVPEVGQLSLFG